MDASGTPVPVLQLTGSGQQQYTQLIQWYRQQLSDQRDAAAKLVATGSVGNLLSAHQTQTDLNSDATEFLASLDSYISYLDQFNTNVQAAFAQMQGTDNAN